MKTECFSKSSSVRREGGGITYIANRVLTTFRMERDDDPALSADILSKFS